jgi:hypothetical protein
MNNKIQFKVKHNVVNLVNFIGNKNKKIIKKRILILIYLNLFKYIYSEGNEVEKFKKFAENFPQLIEEFIHDDIQPIFYAIRYNNFKIFKLILEKSIKKYEVKIK